MSAAVSVQFAAPVLEDESVLASETATASGSTSPTKTPVHAHEQRFTKITRYVSAKVRHAVYLKHDGQGCMHVDKATGRRCGSRFQLQYDHIKPWAMGGEHEPNNLRLMCGSHNRHRN